MVILFFFQIIKMNFIQLIQKLDKLNWKNEINSILRPIVIGKYIMTVSDNGYFYIIDKVSGNIIRINDLYKNYKIKKRNDLHPTGFLVAANKIYLSNSDGKLIIADLNTVNILDTIKIHSDRILQPLINNNNLYLIRNGSIIRFN